MQIMADYPIYENDAAIAQKLPNYVRNIQPANSRDSLNGPGGSIPNRHKNIVHDYQYRQQSEANDIYLIGSNRIETVENHGSRRDRRKKHAVSAYDEDNYALAGPISSNSLDESIDSSNSKDANKKYKCYNRAMNKRWIFLVAFIISLICVIIAVISTTSSDKGPKGK